MVVDTRDRRLDCMKTEETVNDGRDKGDQRILAKAQYTDAQQSFDRRKECFACVNRTFAEQSRQFAESK